MRVSWPKQSADMLAIDTNLVIRYLTNDHPKQSPRARALIDGEAVFVAVTVMLEVEWVLRSTYEYRPADVARAMRSFAGLPTVTVEDGAVVATALDLAERGMDFADALHLGKAAHCSGMASFDRKFVKAAKAAGYNTVREA
ncbi:predicted nucleic-acid-binding protein [Rhizobium subbaraonis]|uniref:Predicted nucleic-acid-binding protein n=2 Tax=Hyphomicrobiales TaxID=356 RepID=A0A285UYD2_9HYPH|nr:predicted nucleic-acid-binding protein [Rhizobium subbaraonis]